MLFAKYCKLIESGAIRPQTAIEKLPKVLSAIGKRDPNINEQLLSILKKVSTSEYDNQLVAFAIQELA